MKRANRPVANQGSLEQADMFSNYIIILIIGYSLKASPRHWPITKQLVSALGLTCSTAVVQIHSFTEFQWQTFVNTHTSSLRNRVAKKNETFPLFNSLCQESAGPTVGARKSLATELINKHIHDEIWESKLAT